MTIKEWSTNYPGSQDSPTTEQPDLDDGVDAVLSSHVETLRTKLDNVAKKVGDNSNLPAGSLRARVATLEATAPTHSLGGASHSATTLAALNALVSDANLDDLTASRTPSGSAGGQLGGTYPNPDVRGIRETAGPTTLTFGSITDGQTLVRSGATIIGGTTLADESVKVSVTDTTPGKLTSKLSQGAGVTFTVLNPAGNEQLQISQTASTQLLETGGPTTLSMAAVADTRVLTRSGATVVGVARAGVDTTAIHNNVAGEIAALTLVTIASADHVLIEDASNSNAKRRVLASDFLSSGIDITAIHQTTAGEIAALSTVTVASGDFILIEDVSDSNNKKKILASDLITPASDADAIHDNVAGEIAALSLVTVASGDYILIEDVSDSNNKKRILASDLISPASDADAIHDNVAGEIAALSTVTVASGDFILIEDVSDSNNKKKILASDLLGSGGTDVNAIHKTTAGEISVLTLVTVASGDHLLIEDVSDSNNKKRILASDLLVDTTALHGGTAGEIAALSTVTVASGDFILIEDVSDSNNKKKVLASDLLVDTTALHSGTAGEIAALTLVTAASGDFVLIEDVSDSNNKKRVLVSDFGGGTDTNAIHKTTAGEIAALTTVTVASGDFILIEDVSDSNNKKKILASDLISGSGIGASTEKLITPVILALHDYNDLATEKVIGSFYFDPSEYSLSGTSKTISLQVVASVGNSSITGHVKLRDVTTGVDIHTFDLNGAGHTTPTKFTQTLTTGTPGTNIIANSDKLYELRIYVDSPSIPTDIIDNWKSEIRVINTIT